MSSCSHGPPTAQSSAYPEQNYSPGAKWIKGLTQARLGQFTGGHFADVNLSSVLFHHRIDDSEHVELQVWSAPGLTKPSFEEAMKQEFKPAKKGDSFGPSWTNHWWKVKLTIPKDWKKYERVQFEFDPGCEAMVFTTDGTPLQGITGGGGGDRRVDHIIPHSARNAGTYEIVIESSCNGMFGVPWNGNTIAPPDMDRYFGLASADLVVPNEEAWRLMWDFTTLREIAGSVPGNTPLQNKAIVAANAMMNVFDAGDPGSVARTRAVAEEVLGKGWQARGADIYKDGSKDAPIDIWGIGHCHIDTAWLWPFRVTQQKVARSWSTQVDLMHRYPEHRFCCSSAQQYKWLEQLYPKLFENVKEQVLAGKFHPVGGSWVENDGNMPSGEALIRQMTFGQRYFESRFGIRCETAWLPDSFGLTGAYPQLIRGAGMKYFFTQKLSWNNINVFPHSTFNWVGIDGTQVLCHMTPVDTYTAQATVGDIRKGITNNKNLESNSSALLVFGNGDGGGGPLNKMLENLRRIRAVANTSREMPVVHMGHSVDDFFREVERKSKEGKTLPAWHGELYLEFHRGTYTSHGSIKKGNRRSEILLREVEFLATLASILSVTEYQYPKEKIGDLWERLLLCQFHDVLPGSAIGMVYEDAEEHYAHIFKEGHKLLEDALQALSGAGPSWLAITPQNMAVLSKQPANGGIIAFNSTPFPRCEVVKVPLADVGAAGALLKSAAAQVSEDGKTGYVLMQSDGGFGLASPRGLSADCDEVSVGMNADDGLIMQNSAIQIRIWEGRIVSLKDRALDRELIAHGETGGMVIFEDRPNYWDAWDVEIHHLEKRTPLLFEDLKIITKGPVHVAISADVKFGNSKATITISLDAVPATMQAGSRPFFRFDAEVDWHERHQFLKFELPLDIHSTNAIYETQFGFVERPTHKNTTWDAAKFEVCGLKYADLSEYGYGVAILSESKYGFACTGNILRISLLRGATAPDAEQDQGKHEFSWAVLPHQGHFLQSDVPQAAYLFNSPLHVRYATSLTSVAGLSTSADDVLFSIRGAPSVILETVKRGDDDDDNESSRKKTPKTIVLRMYESMGGHARGVLRISSALGVVKAFATSLLEDELAELPIFTVPRAQASADSDIDSSEENAGRRSMEVENAESMRNRDIAVPLSFRGFEVKTVKLVLGDVSKEAAKPTLRQRIDGKERWVNVGK